MALEKLSDPIKRVRKSLGMTQIEFADKIGTKQSVIAGWETGRKGPSSEHLVKIASLTTDETLKRQLLDASGLAEFVSPSGPKPKPSDFKTLSIRLLRDPAAAGTPRMIDERETEKMIVLPEFMFPEKTGEIVAIRVKGASMEPMVMSGSIVFIDISQRDPKELVGKMVAARVDGGVTIKFLRKSRGHYILLPFHVSPNYELILLSDLDGDAIVGRVLRWISEPPKK